MTEGWEVVGVNTPEEATPQLGGAGAMIVEQGTSDAGLELVERLRSDGGSPIPSVIIGDRVPDALPDGVRVLPRPFDLSDLRRCISDLTDRSSEAPARPTREHQDVTGRGQETEQPEPALKATAIPPTAPPRIEPEDPPSPAARTGSGPHVPSVEPPIVSTWEGAPGAEPPARAPTPNQADEQPPGNGSTEGGLPDVERAGTATEVDQTPPPPARTVSAQPSGAGATEDVATGATHVRTGPRAPGIWTWRSKAREADGGGLFTVLTDALQTARTLERLVDDLPALSDRRSFADAVVSEVAEVHEAETIALLAPRGADESYVVVAHQGLTSAEVRMRVDRTQPLLRYISERGQPALVAPVSEAGSFASGIPGARTDELMVAPLHTAGEEVAVIVVGGPSFSDSDCDRLGGLAAEAAPGLLLSQLVERLRSLGGDGKTPDREAISDGHASGGRG